MQDTQYIEEDKIDLKDLLKIILDKKKFIGVFTFIITILSMIYVFFKTPIYEVKSVIKIGYIGDNLVEKSVLLKKKLDIVFQIGRPTNKITEGNAIVSNISTVKNIDNLIEVSTQAYSNEKAKNKNEEVLSFIKNEYQLKFDEYNFNTELKIKNLKLALKNVKEQERINVLNEIKKIKTQELVRIDASINVLKKQKIPNIDKKIKFLNEVELELINNKLSFNNKKLKEYEENIKKIVSKNTKTDTQSLISAMHMLSNQNLVLNLQNIIEDLNKQKAKVLNFDIRSLEDEKLKLLNMDLKELYRKKENIINDKLRKLILKKDVLLKEKENRIIDEIKVEQNKLTKNYVNNSEIIGEIIIDDYPIKPKKKIIIILTFIISLIFSIFIVLLLNFVNNLKFNKDDK